MNHMAFFGEDGRLISLQSIEADLDLVDGAIAAVSVPAGTNPNSLYLDTSTGRIGPRPSPTFDRVRIPADGLTAATMTDLPRPCAVTINGQTYTVEDGQLELTFSTPGTYRVSVVQWPCVPLFQEIVAYEA